MNKMLKIGILCVVFLLCDCQVQAQKIETTQNNAIQYERTKKAEIVSAFSFWINKNCWLYGSSEYADIQNKIKIYYKHKKLMGNMTLQTKMQKNIMATYLSGRKTDMTNWLF